MNQSVSGSSSLISQLLGADRSITATFFATRLSRMSIDPVRTTQSSLHPSGSGMLWSCNRKTRRTPLDTQAAVVLHPDLREFRAVETEAARWPERAAVDPTVDQAMSAAKMLSTEVLIVGAGPTGLVLGLWLTLLGVRCGSWTDRAAGNDVSRAGRAGTHARTIPSDRHR